MKKQIKKWSLRLTAIGLFILALLVGIVLNPSLTYASSTAYNNYTIYHDKPIDGVLLTDLDKASDMVKKSELYDSKLKLDICLKEDSKYPAIMQGIFGKAFATGFYNKVVVMGNTDYKSGCVEINGYKWNFVELLAHEMVHCYQFNTFGLLKSNPLARIPTWKWEDTLNTLPGRVGERRILLRILTGL